MFNSISSSDSSSIRWSSSASLGLSNQYIFPDIFNSKWKKNPQHWLLSSWEKSPTTPTLTWEFVVSLRYNLLSNIKLLRNVLQPNWHLKCYGLTLVTYKRAASNDLEPMHLIYVTIFKKRVCVYLLDQLWPLQG